MKKKKFAVEKAVDILVNHTTPFRAFLPSTVICFIQVLNNRSIPLLNFFFTGTRINTRNAQLGLLLSQGKVILERAPSKHDSILQPLSHSTLKKTSTRWCREPLAATVRED